MSDATDADADTDATGREERIAELEAEVERLRQQQELHQEVLALLAANADSEAIPDLTCPYCGEGHLAGESGVTWEQISCTTCEFATYL